MKIIFVRHGKDPDGFLGGWSRLDLVPEGVQQAKRLARHLKANASAYGITRILASDLPRAATTAAILSAELGLPVELDRGLREMNNGDLAGLPIHEAQKKYPGLYFHSLDMDQPYPGGESPSDFFARVQNWFAAFLDGVGEDGNVLVVTHGGVLNILYHIVTNQPWSNKIPPYRAGNCSVHVLDVETMKFEIENRMDFLNGEA